MTIARSAIALLLAVAAAGCSKSKPDIEANVMPTNYRDQIATYLGTVLTDRADFQASLIGAPTLMQTGANEHYVVCVMLNGHNQHKEKLIIYLGPNINQFIDAAPGQCSSAPYQPFKELTALTPPK